MYSKPKQIFYVCNQQKCPGCDGGWCRHTTDIDYALYDDHPDETFDYRQSDVFGPQLWERFRKEPGDRKKTRGLGKKTGGNNRG